jgi:hypothetical protein
VTQVRNLSLCCLKYENGEERLAGSPLGQARHSSNLYIHVHISYIVNIHLSIIPLSPFLVCIGGRRTPRRKSPRLRNGKYHSSTMHGYAVCQPTFMKYHEGGRPDCFVWKKQVVFTLSQNAFYSSKKPREQSTLFCDPTSFVYPILHLHKVLWFSLDFVFHRALF